MKLFKSRIHWKKKKKNYTNNWKMENKKDQHVKNKNLKSICNVNLKYFVSFDRCLKKKKRKRAYKKH